MEFEGYAQAYEELNKIVKFTDEVGFLNFMFAEVLSKINKAANLNFGFSGGQGVLLKWISLNNFKFYNNLLLLYNGVEKKDSSC